MDRVSYLSQPLSSLKMLKIKTEWVFALNTFLFQFNNNLTNDNGNIVYNLSGLSVYETIMTKFQFCCLNKWIEEEG